MTDKEKHTHTNVRPGMSEHTADMIAQKQQEQNKESAQHSYPKVDEREVARREHRNGSTPRGAQ